MDNSSSLNDQSRRSAKCETPRVKSNAALVDLPPLECSKNTKNSNDQSFLPFDREGDDVDSSSLIEPSQLSLSNKYFDESSRQLHISWLPRMNMSYYGCDQVKVQCVPEEIEEETNQKEVGPKEVYSRPLKCNNIENNTLINVVRYCITITFIFVSGGIYHILMPTIFPNHIF